MSEGNGEIVSKVLLNGDEWIIVEAEGEQFFVYQNGERSTSIAGGGVYETLSGACYAILHAYEVT